MNRSDTGTLIAFEGIDGAGKTTQVNLLTAFLESCGIAVVKSKEPTDSAWGRKIRESASNGRMPLSDELQAFIEDRKEHLSNTIMPALLSGKTVILDRYFYSTVAYQGSRGGKPDAILSLVRQHAPEPNAVILLDVPPAVGLDRISEGRKETPNAFETMKNLKAVREVFLDLQKDNGNISRFDGTPSVSSVHISILRTLLEGALKHRYCAKSWGCDGMMCAYRMANQCLWANMMAKIGPLETKDSSPV